MKYLILFLSLLAAACGITDSTGSLLDRKPRNRTLTIAAIRDSTVSESEWSGLVGRASSELQGKIGVQLRNAGSVQVSNPPTSIYVIGEFAEKAGLEDSDIYFSVSNRRSEEVIGSKGIAGQALLGGREGQLFVIGKSRSTMVIIHEIGHMIGMEHEPIPNPLYVMNLSGGQYLTKNYAAKMDSLFRSDCASGSCPKRGAVQSCTWSDD